MDISDYGTVVELEACGMTVVPPEKMGDMVNTGTDPFA